MINNDDEFAFPLKNALSNDHLGMTLRDYFAAKAMAASMTVHIGRDVGAHVAAAYKMADAMIKERSK